MLVDNLLQALLNAQVLGNLMENPAGFATSPAFQDDHHTPLIRPSSGLVYYGNSEGGIMGGAFTALSTEVHRAVLGVPGMDYAVLLSRSADFSPFQGLLDKAYPDRAAAAAGVRPHADAVGPWRRRRLRRADDVGPAGDTVAPGPAGGGLR